MHIPYNDNDRVAVYEITLSDKIWQFVRFLVVTGLIFALSFFVINFTAYQQIFASVLDPDANAQAEKVLSEASGSGKIVSPDDLLPVLPDKKQENKQFGWVDTAVIVPTDNRLVVPKLGKSVPLVEMSAEHIEGENWSELEKQIQDGLRQGVVHYPGTAEPGQFGNVFITGHSSYYPWDPGQFKDVFALLGQLEIGDEFIVYYNQQKHVYRIYDKFEVNPNNVNVLEQPHDKKIATLMTCTPVGTTLRRLIIKANEIS